MTAVLYRRERELLTFIWQFQERNGYSPTLREMADAMNRRAPSTIHSLIRGLVDKGYLQKVDGNMRTLKILKKEQLGALIGEKMRGVGTTIALPLMGFIAAGAPLEPHTDPEASLDVASSMISGKRTSYALVRRFPEIKLLIGYWILCIREMTTTLREVPFELGGGILLR